MSRKPKSKAFIDDSSDSDGEPKQKRVKKKQATEEKEDDDGPPFEIGGRKKVSINHFKGKTLIDIREFYSADGEDKPGRKGVSLSVEQWEKLKELIPKIEEELKK